MLSCEQVRDAVAAGRESGCAYLDSRDYCRLADFFPASDWEVFGFSLKEGAEVPEPREWTRENILSQLRDDLDFAIEKAEGQRGISASLMYEVVKMWMWVLEDELQHADDDYDPYGLPFLREVRDKYQAEIREAQEAVGAAHDG